jgi:hypothetical protein
MVCTTSWAVALRTSSLRSYGPSWRCSTWALRRSPSTGPVILSLLRDGISAVQTSARKRVTVSVHLQTLVSRFDLEIHALKSWLGRLIKALDGCVDGRESHLFACSERSMVPVSERLTILVLAL